MAPRLRGADVDPKTSKSPAEAGLSGGGDPNDAKLEPDCGLPHRLGGAPRACGVTGQSELRRHASWWTQCVRAREMAFQRVARRPELSRGKWNVI